MKINNNKIKSLFFLSLLGSGLGKENNQTGIVSNRISFNLLPKLATNSTLDKINQEDPRQNLLLVGSPILVGINGLNGTAWNKCRGSFLVVNTNSSECENGNDYGGFLTSFFCFPPVFPNPNATQPGVVSWDNSVSLGKLYYGPTMYWDRSIDNYWHLTAEYFYISADLTSVELFPFVPKNTSEGINLLPVVSPTGPIGQGWSVCVYGSTSGYNCGNINEVDQNLIVPNPLPWLGGDLMLKNLNKVLLEPNVLLSEDIGAPVYSEIQDGDLTWAQARGHVSVIDNSDPQSQVFYYTPLEQGLDGIKNEHYCSYTLMTHDEKKSQEYDKLLTQIEIPPKK